MTYVHDKLADLTLEVTALAQRYNNPWLYRCKNALLEAQHYEEEAVRWARNPSMRSDG
jgi:hypothetical protein